MTEPLCIQRIETLGLSVTTTQGRRRTLPNEAVELCGDMRICARTIYMMIIATSSYVYLLSIAWTALQKSAKVTKNWTFVTSISCTQAEEQEVMKLFIVSMTSHPPHARS